MKHAKDRLYSVMVIGATPAGIAATNKLGELGIPVTLIDRAPDLDQKLNQEQWRLESGVPLNYAHRPGLLRILRNPRIHCILPGRITSLKHTPQGFRARIRRISTFVDPQRCTLCGRCVAVCPVITPDGGKPIQFNGRRSLPGSPVIDKRKTPPCQSQCPLGVNAQAYVALTRAGRFQEALEIVRRDNVLPGICGRVCTHPCEAACRRRELDEPVAIRDIKRFLADQEKTLLPDAPKIPADARRVAVIGSGPAGLAAAAELTRRGMAPTVLEKEPELGGLLRYGIGAHRLPRRVLDRDLDYIRTLGVRFETGRPISIPEDLGPLREQYEAILLTTGAWTDRKLGVPGEEHHRVQGCIAFLQDLYRGRWAPAPGEEIVVIGDGNAAFDLARILKRRGARPTLLSWFPQDLLPADPDEIRGAREEAIPIRTRLQVAAFSQGPQNRLALRCLPTTPGEPDAQGIPWPVPAPGSEPVELVCDRALVAIGQAGPFDGKPAPKGLRLTDKGWVAVNAAFQTSIPGLYAAGDAVSGPTSVVQAMAAGRNAANALADQWSPREPQERPWRPAEAEYPPISTDIPSLSRPTMPERQISARANNFEEVALGLSRSQATLEAERCLQCGVCSECLLCTEACGDISAIHHEQQTRELLEQAGVVIVADPEIFPIVKGEDVIRAYGPKTAHPDLAAMMIRGFAAAAGAMVLLGGTAQRPKGHGFSFTPPEPDLPGEIRMGVFVCRCNEAFGWDPRMGESLERIGRQDSVVHTEVLNAACIPEGASRILRVFREKGLTRIVLAACICCPLDFICSACTEQRSRLKNALFNGTGLSRSMVETCNLRGEALTLLPGNPTEACDRFDGLLARSVFRAKRLRPLPSPARTYNFTTAVIGQSEAAITSAQILARSGLEVFLFGSVDTPLSEGISHPNVMSFDQSVVTRISGTLGDFHIFIESNGTSQVLQVGSVIIGEKSRSRIPYVFQEGISGNIITAASQKRGFSGVPFLYPGATSIAGLFLANPPAIRVSERKKGAAAAALAAAVMPRGPRQSKGFTVVVDKDLCRGCGRCLQVCPYNAITFHSNDAGGRYAAVDEALCKGCGNCISVCPSNAADSPYRDQAYLEQMLEEMLVEREEAFA